MFDFSEVLAWIAIGAGVGIVGNLWHARRDATGVVLKLVAGAAGAVVAGGLAALMAPQGRASMRLFASAVGGFIALALLQFVWAVVSSHRSPQEPDLQDDAPGNKITAKPTSPGGLVGRPHAPSSRSK